MSERLKTALRSLTADLRIDYLAMYPAIVLKDEGAGLVDIRPDDPRLPAMTDIPVRTCVPGLRLKVKRGSRVLLAFENGDPTRPVVHLWEAGALLSVEVKTLTGYRVQIDEEARKLTLTTPAGRVVELDDGAAVTTVQDPHAVVVEAPQILLGGDTPVARKGDEVQIQLGEKMITGSISTGSSKVKAG